jgi:hypothetical protein
MIPFEDHTVCIKCTTLQFTEKGWKKEGTKITKGHSNTYSICKIDIGKLITIVNGKLQQRKLNLLPRKPIYNHKSPPHGVRLPFSHVIPRYY